MKGRLAALALAGVALTGCTPHYYYPTTTPVSTITATPIPKDPYTVAQRSAVRKAESYLNTFAFSRDGLIRQLKYEEYKEEDAVFAVEHIQVDWNKQAVRKAQSYLDTMPFSRERLIQQLRYDGFTPEQAEYGVNSVGLF